MLDLTAALMKNTGCVFANDPSKDRCKAIIGNLHRLGMWCARTNTTGLVGWVLTPRAAVFSSAET